MIINSTFHNNTSDHGGAVRYQEQPNYDATTSITNCTFTNNNAKELGSSIYNIAGGLSVNNCTFIENRGAAGYLGTIATASYFANCSTL